MTVQAPQLTTRQLWVLQAVAAGRVDHDPLYGDLATHILDGHSVSGTIFGLALRGLVACDPLLPSAPHLTRRGHTTLDAHAHRGATHAQEGVQKADHG